MFSQVSVRVCVCVRVCTCAFNSTPSHDPVLFPVVYEYRGQRNVKRPSEINGERGREILKSNGKTYSFSRRVNKRLFRLCARPRYELGVGIKITRFFLTSSVFFANVFNGTGGLDGGALAI